MSKERRIRTRKILVASVGVATVSYALAACKEERPITTGNLMPPIVIDSGPRDAAAAAPDAAGTPPDAGVFGSGDAPRDVRMVTSGNLMPPPDAGTLHRIQPDASAPEKAR